RGVAFCWFCLFFFQAEDGIRDGHVTGVQTCALPICSIREGRAPGRRAVRAGASFHCCCESPESVVPVRPSGTQNADKSTVSGADRPSAVLHSNSERQMGPWSPESFPVWAP